MDSSKKNSKDSDHKIISLLISDDDKGLKILYEKYFSLVFSFFLKESHSTEDSKDLAQEVFIKLWRTRHKLESVESIKNYLFIIARNTFIDYIRRKINQRVFEQLNSYVETELSELDENNEELIDQLVAYSQEMPEKRLEVFRLRWIEGKSRKEIAERLDISIVTVDIHLRKALDFLKNKAKSNRM